MTNLRSRGFAACLLLLAAPAALAAQEPVADSRVLTLEPFLGALVVQISSDKPQPDGALPVGGLRAGYPLSARVRLTTAVAFGSREAESARGRFPQRELSGLLGIEYAVLEERLPLAFTVQVGAHRRAWKGMEEAWLEQAGTRAPVCALGEPCGPSFTESGPAAAVGVLARLPLTGSLQPALRAEYHLLPGSTAGRPAALVAVGVPVGVLRR